MTPYQQELIRLANDEWLAYYQYWAGAAQVKNEKLKAELLEHADEERKHSDWLTDILADYGLTPEKQFSNIIANTNCGYDMPVQISDGSILQSNLAAERCAIEAYSKVLLQTDNPEHHKVLHKILTEEIKHEQDLLKLQKETQGMYLVKAIIRKSQMSFDFGKHEEERTVHATTRHMQSGAVAQVKEHQRRTMVADKPVHEMTRDEFDKWVGRRSPTDIIGKMMQEKHAGKTAQEVAAHYTQKYKLSKPINLVEFKTLQAWHDYLKKIGAKRDPLNGHGGGYHAPTDNYHNIVMVRDDQTDENYLGILRHEIEHAIDRDKGYEPAIYNTMQENIDSGKFQKLGKDLIVHRAKYNADMSIGDIIREPNKGHHQHYDYFELDYPRRSMVRQAIKQGKAVPESIRAEFADRHSAAQQKREEAATAKNAEVLAVRQERAREDFAEALQNMAGITKEQADRVTQYYLDKKLATMDSVNGTIRAKHGAYLDKEVILTAVKETAFQVPIMEVPKRKQRTNPEPKPAPEHRIVKVDDPDGGHGHFIIYDKDMKTVEIPNEHGEIEAAWPRLLDAGRALDRHKGITHKQVKVARGEYDMHKSVVHPVSLIKSGHDVSHELRGEGGKWAKTGEPNMVHPASPTKIGRGVEVARMLQPMDVADLYDSNKVTFDEAKEIGREYYETVLMPHTITSPAFNHASVSFDETGWQHINGEHMRELPEASVKRRIKMLPKVKATLESTPFIDEKRDRADGATEYGLLGRFADGQVIRVVVEEVTKGSKTFLSVFDWEDVSKKIKRESQPTNPLQADALRGVGLAPHATAQDNITKSTVLRKSKNNIEYNYLKPTLHNDGLHLIKSRKLHGRMDYQGIPISIETGRSRIRGWHNPHDNTSGMMLFKDHYGYITNGPDGTDGDKLDVFIGPNPEAKNAYIIDQNKAPDYTEFDEQKVMLGYDSEEAAKAAYLKHYDNKRFFAGIKTMPMAEFRQNVTTGACQRKRI